MASKLAAMSEDRAPTVPPEAEADFDEVSDEAIAAWRAKLAARFGIGEGQARVVEDIAPPE